MAKKIQYKRKKHFIEKCIYTIKEKADFSI